MTPITDAPGLMTLTGCTRAIFSDEEESASLTFGAETLYVCIEVDEDGHPSLGFYTSKVLN